MCLLQQHCYIDLPQNPAGTQKYAPPCPAPSGGGKNDIPNRLKRQFALFNVPLPSVAAINGIFGRLMEGRFTSDVFADEVRAARPAVLSRLLGS